MQFIIIYYRLTMIITNHVNVSGKKLFNHNCEEMLCDHVCCQISSYLDEDDKESMSLKEILQNANNSSSKYLFRLNN